MKTKKIQAQTITTVTDAAIVAHIVHHGEVNALSVAYTWKKDIFNSYNRTIMKTANDNWWTDPKNAEEVERVSWWNHPENRTVVEIPVALVHTDNDNWVISTLNDDSFLGKNLHACAQGNTKDEAIKSMFNMIQIQSEWLHECRLKYQRWVPFRTGPRGSNWFAIFGINVSFRYGKNMKYGWYVPFTKLNISINSDWSAYKRWKKEQS